MPEKGQCPKFFRFEKGPKILTVKCKLTGWFVYEMNENQYSK
jgi:hypothetical protein